MARPTPGFRLLAPRTERGYISVVLSHPVCGTLLEQPQETNTRTKQCTLQQPSKTSASLGVIWSHARRSHSSAKEQTVVCGPHTVSRASHLKLGNLTATSDPCIRAAHPPAQQEVQSQRQGPRWPGDRVEQHTTRMLPGAWLSPCSAGISAPQPV